MAKTPTHRPTDKKPAPAVVPPISVEPGKDSAIDARLAIPLDKDGRVLVGNMRDTSRDKLKDLLTNKVLAKELGVSDASVAPSMALPPELMYPLISGLSILETLVVAKATGAPRDIVERLVPYTPEEAAQLAPALAAVLEKYSGTVLVKYEKEAALAALLIAFTIRKVSLVNIETAKRGGQRGVVLPMTAVDDAAGQPEEPNT